MLRYRHKLGVDAMARTMWIKAALCLIAPQALTMTAAHAQDGCFGYMPELSSGKLANGQLLLCPPLPLTPVQSAYFQQRGDILSLRISREANQCQQLLRNPGGLSESMRPVRPDETEVTCIARVSRETPLPPVPDTVVQFLALWNIAPDTALSRTAPSTQPPDVRVAIADEISAIDLRSAFAANNLRAETKYSGKTYDVTGSFGGAQNGMFHTGVVIKMSGENPYQDAFWGTLADGEADGAMGFDKGQHIRLRCVLGDTTLGTPHGTDCRIITAAAPAAPVWANPTNQPTPIADTAEPPMQPPALVSAPAAQAAALPVDPDVLAFAKGKRDRLGWENFFAGVVGDTRDGALWWTGQRSLKVSGSCSTGQTVEFRHGCEQAQAILGPTDVLRKTSPAYRSGWNSF
jgi:hypothetical protein